MPIPVSLSLNTHTAVKYLYYVIVRGDAVAQLFVVQASIHVGVFGI
jgi:hypothetical protein